MNSMLTVAWLMLANKLSGFFTIMKDLSEEAGPHGVVHHSINQMLAGLDHIHYDGDASTEEELDDLNKLLFEGSGIVELMEHSPATADTILNGFDSFLGPFMKMRAMMSDVESLLDMIRNYIPDLVEDIAETHGFVEERSLSFWCLDSIQRAGNVAELQESNLTPLAFMMLHHDTFGDLMDAGDINWMAFDAGEE